jgi:cob(I)alamin adenosyltransferase
MVASTMHLARTVCRRAERRIISLSEKEYVDPIVIKYVNRLSDTFFTMARWEAYNHNEPEYYWQKIR